MRLLLSSLLVLILAAATPLAFDAAQRRGAGGGGAATFAVVVTDSAGAPVGDVKVTITGAAERSGRTEAGRLVFENMPSGAYRFRFEKDGFVTLERELAGRGGAPIDVKVTLASAPPPPAPPPPPTAPAAPPPAHIVDAKPVGLDLPAFIEKNYVGRASGKSTLLACATGGPATLLQINDPVAEHTHADADEFLYVIAGLGTARMGDRQEPLSSGVFVLIPRGMAHSITAGPRKPLVLLSTRAGEQCGGGEP
jgi:mannose-6-phosphate isomerase-like protein (cupin superfamily)